MAGGRQREFDKQQALDNAMKVFWQKGFVGASLMDLTKSMGINKPSMYAAFGNKEQLFIQATENYMNNYAAKHMHFLEDKSQTMIQRLKSYLMSVLSSQCGSHGPTGCYVSVCVTEAASEDMPVQATDMINQVKNLGEQTLIQFFEKANKDEGFCHPQSSQNLARFYITVLHGTAAMARAGCDVEHLESIIDIALIVIESSE